MTTTAEALALVPSDLSENECWEYTGFLNHDGYGQYSDEQHRTRRIHRDVFELHHGPLAQGEIVRHTCDNRACCNPAHLLKGTQLQNMRDCIERGRFPDRAGEANGRAVLNEQLVRDLRKLYSSGMWSYGLLGQLFGIKKTTIAYLLKGKSWKNILPKV